MRCLLLTVSIFISSLAVPLQSESANKAKLSASMDGELKALQNLVNTVRDFSDQSLLSSDVEMDMKEIERKVVQGPFNQELLDAVRRQLRSIVGRMASKHFSGRGDFIVWSQNRWADVGPHDWPDKVGETTNLQVNMARDAYGSASLLLTNIQNKSVSIDVNIAIPASGPTLNLRRGWHVACPDRKYRADALVLILDNQLTLMPGETTCLWFQLDSHKSEKGQHSIPVMIRTQHTKAEVNLAVEVFDVVMPAQFDAALFNYAYLHEMGLVKTLVSESLHDLLNHYINIYIIPNESLPKVKANPQGELIDKIDFSECDRQIETYRASCRQLGFFWGGDAHSSLGRWLFPELEFLSPPWRHAVSAWYAAWLEHLEQKGLSSDDYFMYVYDEKSSEDVRQVYQLLKTLAPDVRLLLNPTTGYNLGELKSIADYVDIWMPSYEAVIKPYPEDFEFLKSTGKTLWMYSCTNGTPMPVYDYNLKRHWIAWRLGITGVAQWAYADHGGWNSSNSWEWVLGAHATIYTQSNAPRQLKLVEPITPSKRWEAWREGSQDYQLLAMTQKLARAASPAKSREVQNDLATAVAMVTDNPEDMGAADGARVILLKALSKQK